MLVQAHGIVDGLPRDLAKDGVLAIEVVTAIHCDEELAVVGVWGILIGTCDETPTWYGCLVRLAPNKVQDRDSHSGSLSKDLHTQQNPPRAMSLCCLETV